MKCLYPPCKHDAYNRGLCKNHFSAAKKLVKNKLTNWTTLVSLGKATNEVVSRGPVTEWFLSASKNDAGSSVPPTAETSVDISGENP